MYAVVAEWEGKTAWWGAYENKEAAEEVARLVNGTVVPWKNNKER